MHRLFGLVLVLLCGLMLWNLGKSALIVASGNANRDLVPLEYAAMAVMLLGSAYGFYVGIRALFGPGRAGGAFYRARKVGSGLIIFGILCIYGYLTAKPTGPLAMLYGAAIVIAAGGTLLFVFRARA